MQRTIRRDELRKMVPLADSTIYEMERRLRDANAARDDLRQAHAVASADAHQLRGALQALVDNATKHPYWPLHRWMRFGAMAGVIEQIKNGTL